MTSNEVKRITKSQLQALGCAEDAKAGSLNPCVVYVTMPGGPDNFLFLQYPKNKLSLKDPKLQIASIVSAGDGKTVRFSLSTDAVAPFVYLTLRGDHRGYFSDNGFLHVSGTKHLTYYSENGITAQQFMDRVNVMSLFSVTEVAEDYRNSAEGDDYLIYRPGYYAVDSNENSVLHSSLL